MQIQRQLEQLLQSLTPKRLDVVNESDRHGGYFPGKESHFKVTIVSPAFQGLRSVQRHQLVYGKLQSLLQPGAIHALALHTYTPDEWIGQQFSSPECAHAPKP